MANVLFLFPPCLPNSADGPYLAPHLLSTILREKGHTVTNMDLNVRFVMDMCSEEIALAAIEFFKINSGSNVDFGLYHLAGLSHSEIILKKLRSKSPISLKEKILFGNLIKEHFFGGNCKTVNDYGTHGLDINPLIKSLFQTMVQKLPVGDSVVCISCAFGDQLPFSLELARLIKLRSPKTKIILGGAQVSLLPDEVIQELARFKLFNTVFTGFAEECISDVIENCPDFHFEKKSEGTTATHKMLNSVPFTQFDDLHFYDDPKLPVLVNKGCYWGKCTFCDYILMGDLGGARYVSRSVEIVLTELKYHREKHPGMKFRLISDAVPPKFYKELCIRANQDQFPLRTSSYMINNKNITEEFWIEAAKAKIDMIVFGTESTNDRVLSLMDKQGRRQDILTNLTHARKHGVPVKINLIPNYPTTTYQEAMSSIKDVSFFEDIIHHVAFFRFYLSANTMMDQSPEHFDIEVNQDVPYVKSAHNGFHSREFETKKGMTPDEEKDVYSVVSSFAIRCEVNAWMKAFRTKVLEKGIESVEFTESYNLHMENGNPMLYSAKTGYLYNIPMDEYTLLKEIEIKKSYMSVQDFFQGKSKHYLEKFYAYGVLAFAKPEIHNVAI